VLFFFHHVDDVLCGVVDVGVGVLVSSVSDTSNKSGFSNKSILAHILERVLSSNSGNQYADICSLN